MDLPDEALQVGVSGDTSIASAHRRNFHDGLVEEFRKVGMGIQWYRERLQQELEASDDKGNPLWSIQQAARRDMMNIEAERDLKERKLIEEHKHAHLHIYGDGSSPLSGIDPKILLWIKKNRRIPSDAEREQILNGNSTVTAIIDNET